MAILTLALIFIPYIPGLRRLPEYLGVYRLIWREHYREVHAAMTQDTTVHAADTPSP
jgi:hypothetical protein